MRSLPWLPMLLLAGCTVGPAPIPSSSGISEFTYPPKLEQTWFTDWVYEDGVWVKRYQRKGWVWEYFFPACDYRWVYYPLPRDGWVYVWGLGWVAVETQGTPPLGNPSDPPNAGLPPLAPGVFVPGASLSLGEFSLRAVHEERQENQKQGHAD